MELMSLFYPQQKSGYDMKTDWVTCGEKDNNLDTLEI